VSLATLSIDGAWDTAVAALAVVVALAMLWARLDRWSRPAEHARQAWRRAGFWRVLLVALTVLSLGVVVEDVVNRDHEGPVLRLDRAARNTGRWLATTPEIRATAKTLSQVAGMGLAVGVGLAAAGLAIARRPAHAAILVVGTLSAWLLSFALKVAFQIPRPGRPRTEHAISGYGFPSGHVLVSVVACGLLAWLVWPWLGRGPRRLLLAGVVLFPVLVGAARVILRVHFASDVIASLAIGALWLNLLILAATRYGLQKRADIL
jgi:undecaprenyl-diphosphatase